MQPGWFKGLTLWDRHPGYKEEGLHAKQSFFRPSGGTIDTRCPDQPFALETLSLKAKHDSPSNNEYQDTTTDGHADA